MAPPLSIFYMPNRFISSNPKTKEICRTAYLRLPINHRSHSTTSPAKHGSSHRS